LHKLKYLHLEILNFDYVKKIMWSTIIHALCKYINMWHIKTNLKNGWQVGHCNGCVKFGLNYNCLRKTILSGDYLSA